MNIHKEAIVTEIERLKRTLETYENVVNNAIKNNDRNRFNLMIFQAEHKAELNILKKILKASSESRAIANNEELKKDCDNCLWSKSNDTIATCGYCQNFNKWVKSV